MHATDASNASRTLLYDIHAGAWDDELLRLLDVPREVLPRIGPSSGVVATTTLGGVPSRSRASWATSRRRSSARRATGRASRRTRTARAASCSSTRGAGRRLAEPAPHDRRGASAATQFALEGSVFVAGAAIQWLRDGLKHHPEVPPTSRRSRRASETTAASPSCPAFAGLGAPHWDAYARGAVSGLTRGSTCRAPRARRARVDRLPERRRARRDGEGRGPGADRAARGRRRRGERAAHAVPGRPPRRPGRAPEVLETTALGAAYLAGLAVGFWKNASEVRANWRVDRRFEPSMSRDEAAALRAGWEKAVSRTKGWA